MIDFDKIKDIAFRGIRRTSVFMGLGVNAARDERLKEYQLTDLVMFRVMPDSVDDQTLAKFKAEFHRWIISNGLRELVETFATFLDQIHKACFLVKRNKIEVSREEANRYLQKFEKMGIKDKLNRLRSEFSIFTDREKYLSSINKARHCITHRQGKVGPEDLRGKGTFRLAWLGMEIYAETTSGNRHSLMPPFPKNSIILESGDRVMMSFVERVKEYKLGETVAFSPNDIGEICLLFHLATDDITKSALEYAKSMGIEIRDKENQKCLCCKRGIPKKRPRRCPVCGHVFQGKGWSGIDAHWLAKDENIMSYKKFWKSLCREHTS